MAATILSSRVMQETPHNTLNSTKERGHEPQRASATSIALRALGIFVAVLSTALLAAGITAIVYSSFTAVWLLSSSAVGAVVSYVLIRLSLNKSVEATSSTSSENQMTQSKDTESNTPPLTYANTGGYAEEEELDEEEVEVDYIQDSATGETLEIRYTSHGYSTRIINQ